MESNTNVQRLLHYLKSWVISGMDASLSTVRAIGEYTDSPCDWIQDHADSKTDIVFLQTPLVGKPPFLDLGHQLEQIHRDANSRGNQCELILESPTIQTKKKLVQFGAVLRHSFTALACQSKSAPRNNLEFIPVGTSETAQAIAIQNTVSILHPTVESRIQNGISNQILHRSMNAQCKQFFVKNSESVFATVTIHFEFPRQLSPLAGIHDLFVSTNSRKQGYGKQILRTAIGSIHEQTGCRTTCIVFANNNVIPFYAEQGFKPVSHFQRWLLKFQT